MSKVNEMFDKLKTIVPEGINKEQEDKETKVTCHSYKTSLLCRVILWFLYK